MFLPWKWIGSAGGKVLCVRARSHCEERWAGSRRAGLAPGKPHYPSPGGAEGPELGPAHKECFPPLPHNLSHHFLLARLIQITSKHVTVAFGMPAQTTPPSLGTNTSLSFRALEPDWPSLVIAEETWPRSWIELIRIFFLLQIWKCDSEKEDL